MAFITIKFSLQRAVIRPIKSICKKIKSCCRRSTAATVVPAPLPSDTKNFETDHSLSFESLFADIASAQKQQQDELLQEQLHYFSLDMTSLFENVSALRAEFTRLCSLYFDDEECFESSVFKPSTPNAINKLIKWSPPSTQITEEQTIVEADVLQETTSITDADYDELDEIIRPFAPFRFLTETRIFVLNTATEFKQAEESQKFKQADPICCYQACHQITITRRGVQIQSAGLI